MGTLVREAALSTPQGANPQKWPRFAERLICPSCRGPLSPGSGEVICTANERHSLPLVDGVPVLLTESERRALHGDLETAGLMRREYKGNRLSSLIKVAKKLIGSTLHLPPSPTVTRIWEARAGELALEVGSGVRRGLPNEVNLDIAAFANVDVIGSALNIPFADNTFGLVKNGAVLEHVREPDRMIAEMHRVLAPGGYCYTEVPFLQHFHAYPNDFQRYTVEGLKQAFRAYDIVETGVCVGPCSAITALVADWFELLTFTRKRWVNDLARAIPLTLLLPLKYLDYLVVRNPRAHEVASGIYLLARKPA
jgi:SAM-dependent methyltransferase